MTNSPTSSQSYTVIGTRPVRPDGIDKVTGQAVFGADVRLSGMLYGAVLRSPHAHARIISIDTSQAEALPGVKAVVTAADLPMIEASSDSQRYQRNNILAAQKVLYFGHAVAAVVATTPHIASEALNLIKVSYEPLQAVMGVRQAMREDAPILLDELRTDELGRKGDHTTNIAAHSLLERGDVESGFAQAAIIVEREFDTDTVHPGYIEPQSATAQMNADGQVTIWCSTQGAFGVRDTVASVLQIPAGKIRVIPLEIGGGFGGKNGVYLEPVAALLSKKCGHHPVKMTMSYNEVLAATGPTSASHIWVKVGVDTAGRIIAAQASLAYAAGAYPGSPIWGGMPVIFGPYRIDNLRIDGYDVLVNRPWAGSYRAPGATNAVFASETVIDELCEKLGMDPIEFRTINGVRTGDRRSDGVPLPRIGFHETLEVARQHPHYTATLEGPHRGRGVACAFWGNHGGKSSATASVNVDGSISLLEGSVDLSGTRVTLAMQLAETLGISVEDIHPRVADTDAVAYTEGSYGSRTTFATGWAVYELGLKLKTLLIERAAVLWEVTPDQVTFAKGIFSLAGPSSDEKMLTLKELAARLDETGSPVMASVSVTPSGAGPTFATHIVDVEVDPETGKVKILQYTAVQDVGQAIHPGAVEGQIQGGVTQGIGWALHEGYFYDEEGHLLNANLLDYRLPTFLDVPVIEPVIVEVPNPGHPYGVRGVGEVPIIPPTAAIANAIYHAVGVRMDQLPMSPDRVLEALWMEKEPIP
jgi:CO/xanthine dehydrogenase Mo-binding subunit